MSVFESDLSNSFSGSDNHGEILNFRSLVDKVLDEAKYKRNDHIKKEGGNPPSLPSVNVLNSILVEAFQASLETEEGEFSRLSLIVMSEEEYSSIINKYYSYTVIHFQEPQECTKRNLAKLASLCEPFQNHLLVSTVGAETPSDDGQPPGQPMIWGLCDIRPSVKQLGHKCEFIYNNKVDIVSFLSINEDPPVLSIMFKKPGHLDLRWKGAFRGEWPPPDLKETIFIYRTAFFSSLIEGVADLFDREDPDGQIADVVGQLIHSMVELAVSRVVGHGGGGAFLFEHEVRSEQLIRGNESSPGLKATYDLQRTSGYYVACTDKLCTVRDCEERKCRSLNLRHSVEHVVRQCLKDESDEHESDGACNDKVQLSGYTRFEIRRLADSMAALTKHDGAVILTDQLRLVSFGSKVRTVKNAETRFQDQLSNFLRKRGTRHSSAAKWVASGRPGSRIGIVVSQDGQVTLFHWAEKEEKTVRASKLLYLEA
jgi:hypothetical protein